MAGRPEAAEVLARHGFNGGTAGRRRLVRLVSQDSYDRPLLASPIRSQCKVGCDHTAFVMKARRAGTGGKEQKISCLRSLISAHLWPGIESFESELCQPQDWHGAVRLRAGRIVQSGRTTTRAARAGCVLLVRVDYIGPRPGAWPRGHGELLKLLRNLGIV